MRHSTQEEKDDYEAMLKRKSTVLIASEEFEHLKAENASLRGAAQGLGRLCDQYKAENDRLIELVRIMHGELVACEDNGYVCGGHKFDNRVRELGIEVGE